MLGGEESTVYKLSSTVSPCDGVQEENKFVSGLQLRRLMAVANWLVWRFAEEEKKVIFWASRRLSLNMHKCFFVDKHYFLYRRKE